MVIRYHVRTNCTGSTHIMAERLKYSPLIEALCEFRFAPSQTWDWTIPGRLYDEIGKEFSERAQVDAIGVELLLAPNKVTAPQVIRGPSPERVQLKRPDGTAMVQVGPHLLVVNHLRPYSDWASFRPMILDAYTKHEKITGPAKVARIGLRYINQIPLPERDCELEEITTLPQKLPGALQKPLANIYQRFELEQEQPKAILVVQAGIQRTEQQNFLILDFDIGTHPKLEIAGVAGVLAWLDEAHDRIDEAFLAAVNPALIEKWKRGGP